MPKILAIAGAVVGAVLTLIVMYWTPDPNFDPNRPAHGFWGRLLILVVAVSAVCAGLGYLAGLAIAAISRWLRK